MMDLRKIKKLIEMLEESNLHEMEISEGDSKIRLSRAAPQVLQTAPMATVQTAVAPSVAPAGTVAPAAEVAPAAPAGTVITSPLVGTFYDSPSPGEPAFVGVGARVKEGDVLCLIEAMKTFNQLEAEVAGTVREIYKQGGDPVEFGEPLFLIGDADGGNGGAE